MKKLEKWLKDNSSSSRVVITHDYLFGGFKCQLFNVKYINIFSEDVTILAESTYCKTAQEAINDALRKLKC